MARPIKTGLDYFPLDVDIDQDDKLAMIEAVHGIEGFGIVVKLFMKIYKEGYFYEWTEREKLLFAKRINVDINLVNDVINDSVKEGIFDREIFGKYSILTSHGIQKRYLEAVKRRKEVEFDQNYFLITDIATIIGNSKIEIYIVNDDGNRVNVNINSVNDNISTQRKEKKSKEKKSKEKNNPLISPLQENPKEDPGEMEEPKTGEVVEDESVKFKQVINLLYQSEIVKPQAMNFFITEDINDVIDNFGFEDPYEMLSLAIKTGAKSGAKTWKYVYSILDTWRKEGIKSQKDINKPAEKGANNKHAGDNEDFKQSWAAALEKRKANRANAF